MMKVCLGCKLLFQAKDKNQKYCGRKCLYLANRKGKFKICVNCEKKFWVRPALENQKFCSKKCFFETRQSILVCKNCKKKLKVPKYLIKTQKYCSLKCAYEDREITTLEEICLNCGKKFKFPIWDKRIYCSKKCAQIAFGKNHFGKDNPMFGKKRPDLAERNQINKPLAWMWKNPKYRELLLEHNRNISREQRIANLKLGRKPTQPELKLQDWLIESNFPFEYVGRFSFFIDEKNPDFVYKERKKVIELFGDYWHSEKHTGVPTKEHIKEIKEYYKDRGYDCLIIWEHELKNKNDVISQIQDFLSEEVNSFEISYCKI